MNRDQVTDGNRRHGGMFVQVLNPLHPYGSSLMQIQRLPISELHPAPYNPRKTLRPGMPGYRRLEGSLREFDLVQPLVWNKTTGHVVSGHQRLDILRARGDESVDVVVVELSLAREQALNIALNNSLVGSEWDPEKLIDIVHELQATPDLDVELTGFDDAELRDLLLTPDLNREPEDDDGEEADVVRVQLEVPVADWEDLRVALDSLLAERDVRLHVRLPKPFAHARNARS